MRLEFDCADWLASARAAKEAAGIAHDLRTNERIGISPITMAFGWFDARHPADEEQG